MIDILEEWSYQKEIRHGRRGGDERKKERKEARRR